MGGIFAIVDLDDNLIHEQEVQTDLKLNENERLNFQFLIYISLDLIDELSFKNPSLFIKPKSEIENTDLYVYISPSGYRFILVIKNEKNYTCEKFKFSINKFHQFFICEFLNPLKEKKAIFNRERISQAFEKYFKH